MAMLPDPVWPVIALAFIQLIDGILCIKPVSFVAKCFEDVGWPRSLWWLMPTIKFAAAAGLIAGIWIPVLGAVTTAALVLYFLVAVGVHVRVRDFGRNLFVNATGMLAICIFVGACCFLGRG
jgi:hypothetical protein